MSEPSTQRSFAPAIRATGKNTNIAKVLAIFGIVGLFLFLAVTATATTFNPADYDANGDCKIERDEIISAIVDYFNGSITRDDVVSLIVLYFSGGPVCELEPDPPMPDPPELADDGTTTQLSAIIERVRPSVVMVVALSHLGIANGSGLIFSVSGQTAYVLTNQHVVGWSRIVQVVVNDEDTYEATVLGRDAARDLAVVKICCGDFTAAEFGDADSLKVGDDVFAVGYPLDSAMPRNATPWYPHEYIEASITKGIVSAFRYETSSDTRLIQTDTPINFGNSGGPVFSMDGKVVGVAKSTFIYLDGLGFAISVTTIREQLSRLLEEPDNYTFGPIAGMMEHDKDGKIKFEHAGGFWARDVDMQATFANPFSTDRSDWSYGFMLRKRYEHPYLFFIAYTDSGLPFWRIFKRDAATLDELALGRLPALRTGEEDDNLLRVVVEGDSGRFYVNGALIWQGGLGGATHAGYLAIGTGFHHNNLVDGYYTEFSGFQGRSLD